MTHSQCHAKIKTAHAWDYPRQTRVNTFVCSLSFSLGPSRQREMSLFPPNEVGKCILRSTIRIWFRRVLVCTVVPREALLFSILIGACVNFKGKISTKWKSERNIECYKRLKLQVLVFVRSFFLVSFYFFSVIRCFHGMQCVHAFSECRKRVRQQSVTTSQTKLHEKRRIEKNLNEPKQKRRRRRRNAPQKSNEKINNCTFALELFIILLWWP